VSFKRDVHAFNPHMASDRLLGTGQFLSVAAAGSTERGDSGQSCCLHHAVCECGKPWALRPSAMQTEVSDAFCQADCWSATDGPGSQEPCSEACSLGRAPGPVWLQARAEGACRICSWAVPLQTRRSHCWVRIQLPLFEGSMCAFGRLPVDACAWPPATRTSRTGSIFATFRCCASIDGQVPCVAPHGTAQPQSGALHAPQFVFAGLLLSHLMVPAINFGQSSPWETAWSGSSYAVGPALARGQGAGPVHPPCLCLTPGHSSLDGTGAAPVVHLQSPTPGTSRAASYAGNGCSDSRLRSLWPCGGHGAQVAQVLLRAAATVGTDPWGASSVRVAWRMGPLPLAR